MADIDLPVEHGLTYPPDFLHSLPVLLSRPAPHSPIRQLTAAQFADLQLRSQLSHAPDSVLFPFLHGLEGDNEAQNSFFSTGYTRLPSGRRGRAKVPQFRGLIWVAVEEDDDESEGSDDDDFDDYSSDIDVDVDAEHDQEDTFAMDLDSEPEPSSSPVPESSYMHPIQTRTAAAPPPTSPAKDGAPPPSSASATPRVPTHERSPTVSSTSSAPPSPTFTTASYATSMSSNPPSPICDADPPLSSECPTPLPMTTTATTTPASSVPRLTSTFKARDLLEVDEHGEARFAHVRVPEGISLRNFGIQVPIYATLSDIVVYSRRGAHRAAFALAEKFKRAIEAKHAERTPVADGEPEPVRYHVFVLHASPDDMIRDLGHALTRTDDTDAAHTDGHDAHVDSAPLPANTVNFAQRERDEMRDLTRASEILSVVGADNDQARAGRVYLGNTNDVPFLVQGEPFVPNKDPGYDLCIECHERAPLPNPTHLLGAEEHLAALNAAWARAGEPGERPAPHPSAVMHIAFPSSPSTIGVLLPFVEFLQRVLEPSDGAQAAPWWNRRRSGSSSSNSSVNGSVPRSTTGRGARVLVWSQDGYTESSVLALALLMVVRGLSLAEAYLDLQVNKKRSFFVYGADLPILRRVDAKLRQPGQQYGHGHGHARTATQTGAIAIQRSPVHTATLAGSLPASYPAGAGGSAQTQGQGQMGMVVRRPRASTSPLLPSLVADHQIWFDDPRFDGSFPSRVLPFLYLGNLNHASNAYMLHALGITHVVSVGECALVPPPELAGASAVCATPPTTPEMSSSSNGSTRAELVRSAQGSLWIEEREGRIKVLDIKGVCDDGIDTLEPQLQPVCDWIEKARKEGGQVLVHCRVGVSRSATVTIAYVMQHLGLPLVDAYLIVRSRRLSVLIQPNMRLLYNLCGWEVKLARERAGADERKLKEELSRTVNWPYLAREVHALNEKYLH